MHDDLLPFHRFAACEQIRFKRNDNPFQQSLFYTTQLIYNRQFAATKAYLPIIKLATPKIGVYSNYV